MDGLSGDPLEAEQRRAPAISGCGSGVSFFWLLFLDKQEK